MTLKSAAIALVLCLALQANADTLLGKLIHVADGDVGRIKSRVDRIRRPNGKPCLDRFTEIRSGARTRGNNAST